MPTEFPEDLQFETALFLPFAQQRALARVSKRWREVIYDPESLFGKNAGGAWTSGRWWDRTCRGAHDFLTSSNTWCWMRALYCGTIREDTAFGGINAQPSSDPQPHDPLLRIALAERLLQLEETLREGKWDDRIPRKMDTKEVLPFNTFMVLAETKHDPIPDFADKLEAMAASSDHNFADVSAFDRDPFRSGGGEDVIRRVAESMFWAPDGVITLFSIPQKPRVDDPHVKDWRYQRHGMNVFPPWLLESLSAVGPMSLVESSNFESEEVSCYLLAAQRGAYVTGFLFEVERDS